MINTWIMTSLVILFITWHSVELTSKSRDKIWHCHATCTATASNTISDREYEAMLTECRRYLARCPQFIVSLECSRRTWCFGDRLFRRGRAGPYKYKNVQATEQAAPKIGTNSLT